MNVYFLWSPLIEVRIVVIIAIDFIWTLTHWMRMTMDCIVLWLLVLQHYLDVVFTGYF